MYTSKKWLYFFCHAFRLAHTSKQHQPPHLFGTCSSWSMFWKERYELSSWNYFFFFWFIFGEVTLSLTFDSFFLILRVMCWLVCCVKGESIFNCALVYFFLALLSTCIRYTEILEVYMNFSCNINLSIFSIIYIITFKLWIFRFKYISRDMIFVSVYTVDGHRIWFGSRILVFSFDINWWIAIYLFFRLIAKASTMLRKDATFFIIWEAKSILFISYKILILNLRWNFLERVASYLVF